MLTQPRMSRFGLICMFAVVLARQENNKGHSIKEEKKPENPGNVMKWIDEQTGNKTYGKELQRILKEVWRLEKKHGDHENETEPDIVMPLIGDIAIDLDMAERLKELAHSRSNGNGNGHGNGREKRKLFYSSAQCLYFPTTIYYDITMIPTSSNEYAAANMAMTQLETTTCLNFVNVGSSSSATMKFTYLTGSSSNCWSNFCRPYNPQSVNIGPGCSTDTSGYGTVWHEIAHALSMPHEQSHSDRDLYLDISTTSNQYLLCSLYGLGNCAATVPFDFESVMLYYFSSSMQPKPAYSEYMHTYQRRDGPAFYDTKAVNNAYCQNTCSGGGANCFNGGYRNPANCGQCLCPYGLTGDCSDVEPSSVGSACGGDRFATSTWQPLQSIQYYPTPISGQQQCIWKITAPAGAVIEFEFTDPMWINGAVQTTQRLCALNHVEVKYLDLIRGGARFCDYNQTPTGTLTSLDNNMIVMFNRFFTSYTDYGFKARYRSIGGGGPAPLPCDSNPCQNGGICSNTGATSYSCSCPSGYVGVNCETQTNYPVIGLDNDCLNYFGTCTRGAHTYGVASCSQTQCRRAIFGLTTSADRPDYSSCGTNMICQSGQCVSSGVSLPVLNGGWTDWDQNVADACAQCSNTYCVANGIVPVKLEVRTCTNPIPYNGGSDCFGHNLRAVECGPQCVSSTSVYNYILNSCPAGTTVMSMYNSGCFVYCRDAASTYLGYRLAPYGSPCGSNGRCYEGICYTRCSSDPTYYAASVADCPVGPPPPCLSNPCQNGGTCDNIGTTSYQCNCPNGYSGTNCETSSFIGLDNDCSAYFGPCTRGNHPVGVPICTQTSCERGIYGLTTSSDRPDLSSCGTNMVCQSSQCVASGTVLPVLNGGWTAWDVNVAHSCAQCSNTACVANGVVPVKLEVRSCTNPVPYNGGSDCSGHNLRAVTCGPQCISSVSVTDYIRSTCPSGTAYLTLYYSGCFAYCRDAANAYLAYKFAPYGSPCGANGRCHEGFCYNQCASNPNYYALNTAECP